MDIICELCGLRCPPWHKAPKVDRCGHVGFHKACLYDHFKRHYFEADDASPEPQPAPLLVITDDGDGSSNNNDNQDHGPEPQQLDRSGRHIIYQVSWSDGRETRLRRAAVAALQNGFQLLERLLLMLDRFRRNNNINSLIHNQGIMAYPAKKLAGCDYEGWHNACIVNYLTIRTCAPSAIISAVGYLGSGIDSFTQPTTPLPAPPLVIVWWLMTTTMNDLLQDSFDCFNKKAPKVLKLHQSRS